MGESVTLGIDILQSGDVIFPSTPKSVRRQGNRVSHAEILERAQELFFQCFRETNFSGKTVAEIHSNACAIHSFRGRRESKEDSRAKLIKNSSITGSRPVVHLVDYHKVVKLLANLIPQSTRTQHLN